MSQMTQAIPILQALTQDCIDAWELTDATVDWGQVRIPKSLGDYAIIDMLPVPMAPLGAVTVRQDYTFRITRRFKFPDSGNILAYKITLANQLIAVTIPIGDGGKNYRGLAFSPYFSEFDPSEEDEPQQKVGEFALLFNCSVSELHHG